MYKTGFCISIVVALSACSSSGSSDNTAGGTTGGTTGGGTTTVDVGGSTTVGTTDGGGGTAGTSQFGFFSYYSDPEEGVIFEGSFGSISSAVPFATVSGEFLPTTDECEVFDGFDFGDLSADFDFIEGLEFSTISAGDSLTVSSAAGTYANIPKIEDFGFVFYTNEGEALLPSPPPAGLTLNIPGEQFPAFTNVALPNIQPLQMSSPAVNSQITASTTYTWVPGASPNSFIDIYVFGTGENITKSVSCTAVDDGSFTFPAATQAEMGSFTGFGEEERYNVDIIQKDNAVLAVSASAERVN